MLETLAHFNFPTHRVHVSRDTFTDLIHCFKYTDIRCDFDIFESNELAGEYILEPFANQSYIVTVRDAQGEPEQEI